MHTFIRACIYYLLFGKEKKNGMEKSNSIHIW
jgi:hypothetical protein